MLIKWSWFCLTGPFSGVTRVQFSGGARGCTTSSSGNVNMLGHFVSCSLKWEPIFSKFWMGGTPGGGGGGQTQCRSQRGVGRGEAAPIRWQNSVGKNHRLVGISELSFVLVNLLPNNISPHSEILLRHWSKVFLRSYTVVLSFRQMHLSHHQR